MNWLQRLTYGWQEGKFDALVTRWQVYLGQHIPQAHPRWIDIIAFKLAHAGSIPTDGRRGSCGLARPPSNELKKQIAAIMDEVERASTENSSTSTGPTRKVGSTP